MKQIVIIGATSAIAHACARQWAERGDRLLLVARDPNRLEEVAQDLRVRSRPDAVLTHLMDATASPEIPVLLDHVRRSLSQVDVVLIAHGTLPDQADCEQSLELTQRTLEVNGTSATLLMAAFANLLESQRSATACLPCSDRPQATAAARATTGTAPRRRWCMRSRRVCDIGCGRRASVSCC